MAFSVVIQMRRMLPTAELLLELLALNPARHFDRTDRVSHAAEQGMAQPRHVCLAWGCKANEHPRGWPTPSI